MPDFTSPMQMHSQDTSQAVIDHERSLVAAELGLGGQTGSADRISFRDEGWSSRVYLLDDGDTVFKFPRSPEISSDYKREIAALLLLDTVECPLPTQRFRADGPNGGFSYYGLVGTQLSELLETLGEDRKSMIGNQIGSFLKYLHTLDLPDVPRTSGDQEVLEYQAKYQLALPSIEAQFSDGEQRKIGEFFHDRLPDEVGRVGDVLKLCHGDLGAYNIVVRSDDTPGIIDFGNIGYYDVSKDFIDFGDPVVLDEALKAYGDDPLLREKIAIRTIALQAVDLVYYMRKKNTAGVNTTTNRLRELLIDERN